MNRSEVAQLFAYACLFDMRLQADEGKILAWDAALKEDMTFEFAKGFVSIHYSNDDKVIAPSYFNKAWSIKEDRDRQQLKTRQYLRELEEGKAKAATQEQVDFHVKQIREALTKGKTSADMADGNGEVASDL